LQCGVGGKIEFVTSGQIPLPPDAMDDIKAMQESGQEPDDTKFGWWDAAEMIPVAGSIIGIVRSARRGNWGMAALNVGFLALDVLGLVSFGATTAASTVAKAGVKTGVRIVAKEATKQVGKSGLQTGARISGKGALKAFRKNIDKIIRKVKGGKKPVTADPPNTFRDAQGRLRNKNGRFAKDPHSKSAAKKPRYRRNMAERQKALLRDARDPNSGLSDRARKTILDSNGKKVPKGYEVSHNKPLYTRTSDAGKAKLDKASNMKTEKTTIHRDRHRVCGNQYHKYGPANKPKNPKP
jgi:hypothetical protein